MDKIAETFVINLPECENRLKNFDSNMKEFDVSYTLWSGTKGSDISAEELKRTTSYICRKFTCTNGTIGCYLSHLKLWKHIREKYINTPDTWFVIFEDDSLIDEKFLNNLSRIFNDLSDWHHDSPYPEYINLASSFAIKTHRVTDNLERGVIVNGTSAYMISYDGIQKLIEHLDKYIHYHVDFTITSHNLTNDALSYYVTKNYVKNSDNFVSSVSNTYPKLLPAVFNALFYYTGVNNHQHIIYDSAFISFSRKVACNICVVVYIIVAAILMCNFKKSTYGWLVALLLAEIIFDIYVGVVKTQSKC